MAQVLVYYDEEEPPDESPQSDIPKAAPEEDDWTWRQHRGERPVIPQNTANKKKQRLQAMTVRLRTRLCYLPRTDPVQVPKVTFRKIKGYTETRPDFDDREPVETRYCIMECASDSPLWKMPKSGKKYDPDEWETSTALYRLCLLPHCEYSLDMNSEIAAGKEFMQEQTQIMAYVVYVCRM